MTGPQNEAMHQSKSAWALASAAFAGDRQCYADNEGHVECVKCGGDNVQADVCHDCEWPLSPAGWHKTPHQVRRLTLDTTCVNSKQKHADLNTLEAWAAAGRIQLQRSDAMLPEVQGHFQEAKASSLDAHPRVFQLDRSVLDGPDVLGGPDLSDQLPKLLFPTSVPLTDNQRADVRHLVQHVRTGGDLFVTLDKSAFTRDGLRQQLQAQGIWAMSPTEAAHLLRDLYGWV